MTKEQSRSLGFYFKKADFLGHRLFFNIEGRNKTASVCGAILSILFLTIVVFYSFEKYQSLSSQEDTKYDYSLYQREEPKEIFYQNFTNFNVAFAIADTITWDGAQVDYKGYLELEVRQW